MQEGEKFLAGQKVDWNELAHSNETIRTYIEKYGQGPFTVIETTEVVNGSCDCGNDSAHDATCPVNNVKRNAGHSQRVVIMTPIGEKVQSGTWLKVVG